MSSVLKNIVIYTLILSILSSSAPFTVTSSFAAPTTSNPLINPTSPPFSPIGSPYDPIALEGPCQDLTSPRETDFTKVPEPGDQRSCLRKVWEAGPLPLAFIWTVLDPKAILWPITLRKLLIWSFYAAIGFGLYEAQVQWDASHKFTQAIMYQHVAIMAVVYGLEPFVSFITLIFSPSYGEEPPRLDEESRIIPMPGAEKVALVITCHQSAPLIQNTLRAAMKLLKPEQIFVIDNANSKEPLDDTREKAAEVHPGINYIWAPYGNKTVAQYIGTRAAENYQFVMIIDDDVLLPDNFDFSTDKIKDTTKAVCFPLKAAGSGHRANLLIKWQDIEYKFADLVKMLEGKTCGVLYPHGAASIWDRNVLEKTLRGHDTIFYAEDVKLGFSLEETGYRLAIANTSPLETEAPESIFDVKNFPYLYFQRVRSWEVGRHLFANLFIKSFFRIPPGRKCHHLMLMKFLQGTAVLNEGIDLIRVPLFVVMGRYPAFWIKLAPLTGSMIIPIWLWNSIKLRHRPDIQVGQDAIFTYPIYKFIQSLMATASLIRVAVQDWPNYKAKPTIPELEKMNHPVAALWMHPKDSEEDDLREDFILPGDQNPNQLEGEEGNEISPRSPSLRDDFYYPNGGLHRIPEEDKEDTFSGSSRSVEF